MVESLVKHLTGEITQDDSLRVGLWREFINEVDQMRVGVDAEASGYAGDVYEVVGLEDDKFGVDDAILFTGTYDIQLSAFKEQGLKV